MFEWYTEEEEPFREKPEVSPAKPEPPRRRWPWAAAAIALALGLGALLLARQLDQRVAGATDDVTADVRAAHQLAQQAALAGDADLLATLVEASLAPAVSMLDRTALGLWLDRELAATLPLTATEVLLSPDLQTAEVTAALPYLRETAAGEVETVWLRQTAVYRRDAGSGAWLLAALGGADDWGGWITAEDGYLRLVYSEREAEIGRRLAEDLAAVVNALCQHPEVACRPRFTIELRLAREADALARLPERPFQGGVAWLSNVHWFLPAPSLVGLPVDEAGYQALYHGYAGWVGSELLRPAGGVEWQRRELAQLGLQPSPPAYHHPRRADHPPPLPFPAQDVLVGCWSSAQELALRRYNPQTETWADETGLALNRSGFIQFVSLPGNGDALLHQYQHDDQENPQWRLLRWRDGQVETLLETERPFGIPHSLTAAQTANGRYLPLEFFGESEGHTPAEGASHLLDLTQCPGQGCQPRPVSGHPRWSPDGQRSLITRYGDGPPMVALGDAEGRPVVTVGPGWSPAWLDDDSFVYVHLPVAPASLAVVQVTIEGERLTVRPLFSSKELVETLPDQGRESRAVAVEVTALPGQGSGDQSAPVTEPSQQLHIPWLLAAPAQPDQLYFTVLSMGGAFSPSNHLFSYHLSTGELRPLRPLGFGIEESLSLSPDGRYLAFMNPFFPNAALGVYDLVSGQTHVYDMLSLSFLRGYDWSADGRWLLLAEGELLRLALPGVDYERLVIHEQEGCGPAVWVNRE